MLGNSPVLLFLIENIFDGGGAGSFMKYLCLLICASIKKTTCKKNHTQNTNVTNIILLHIMTVYESCMFFFVTSSLKSTSN